MRKSGLPQTASASLFCGKRAKEAVGGGAVERGRAVGRRTAVGRDLEQLGHPAAEQRVCARAGGADERYERHARFFAARRDGGDRLAANRLRVRPAFAGDGEIRAPQQHIEAGQVEYGLRARLQRRAEEERAGRAKPARRARAGEFDVAAGEGAPQHAGVDAPFCGP